MKDLKKEILIIICLTITIFSEIPMAKANNNPLESNIEITFELLNNENGETIDSAEIYVIEGWTGTIFYQKIIQSQETISIIPNHSFRFKLIHQDFETWYSKSEVYSSSESITVNFTNGNENYENITDNQVNNTGGEVELEFLEHMSTNSNLNLSWNAKYNFSMHFGTNLLPFNFLGLSSQIDFWFGNKDSTLQINEQEEFLNWFSKQGWSDSYYGGCCRIDGNFIKADDLTGPLNPWIESELGIWGWNETNYFSVKSGFTSGRLLEIPLQNDIRQLSKMTIITPYEWEFRYTPNIDWISGTPTKITVNRSISGIMGYFPIVFDKNTPPEVTGKIIDFQGTSLPLHQNITLDATSSVDSSHDIGLGMNLECGWEISQYGTKIEKKESMLWSVNLSEFGFLPNSTVVTKLICEDPQGLTGLWEKSWYLDITSPEPIEIFGDAECVEKPDLKNLLFCDNLLVKSSEVLEFNFTFLDDGPTSPLISWKSNHIDGWFSEESNMSVIFWQGQNTNINFLSSGDFHQQRELAMWDLNVTLLDEVGNNYFKSWNVTVLDRSAPRIIMKILDGNEELNLLNDINFGDNVTLDINSSFDNIDAIDKVNFIIKLNGNKITNSNETTWDQTKSLQLINLDVGSHQLIINATDSSGNSVENKYEFLVFPSNNLKIIDFQISPSNEKLIVGKNDFDFSITNSGSKSYDVIICVQEQCLDSDGLGATIDGHGYSNFSLTFNLNQSEFLDVNYKFKSDTDIIEYNVTYEFEFKNDKNNFVIITTVSISVFLVIIITIRFIVSNRLGKI